ncbi:SIS domain-containing protein [Bradyrhizobium iriomotense]|uniref:Hexulose-6-phosphate isomerase n=1 Tax=Bradyrhizobium iriomotense TaxID=441950 RepID=A0ABQ6AZB0_9BRAD|nr:SIS domain-containing protein [Bradyrhizobium iriomotense]GLR85238.1 hexulose-6-phosphate isomerase [Bradyrhizobium iriomotense]
MTETLAELSRKALRELSDVFARMPNDCADELIEAIVAARKLVLFGCGCEGLKMRGFAMRLFHLGRDVTVWGDMSMPPVGPDDLLIVSAGPGDLTTARVLVLRAREAGARTALITAQPSAPLADQVDVVTVIPAQTMADDTASHASILPMGSLFEAAQMLFFELVVLKLRPLLHETVETMRARHTNLE